MTELEKLEAYRQELMKKWNITETEITSLMCEETTDKFTRGLDACDLDASYDLIYSLQYIATRMIAYSRAAEKAGLEIYKLASEKNALIKALAANGRKLVEITEENQNLKKIIKRLETFSQIYEGVDMSCNGDCCTPTKVPSHPVQTKNVIHSSARCTESVTRRAYEVYCQLYGPQVAMVTGDCRGGFGVGELIAFLYARSFPRAEWSERVDEAFKGMAQL